MTKLASWMPSAKGEGAKRNKKIGFHRRPHDPRFPREFETIGGGFFVFRRTGATGRIRTPEWPFEHHTLEAAWVERDRLAAQHPNEDFIVVGQVEQPNLSDRMS